MDTTALILSGLLENYCLGHCTLAEIREIENAAAQFPVVKREIESIRASFESYFISNAVRPSPSVKTTVLRSVYKQESAINTEFAPLIDKNLPSQRIEDWIATKNLHAPSDNFENLFIIDLPSTGQVTNFIVFAKNGHEEEVHEDFIEYLYLIDGSCTMDFNGVKRSYAQGELISILPRISHSAVVTSVQPMCAFVQRQAFA